jgi:hypothetical protein
MPPSTVNSAMKSFSAGRRSPAAGTAQGQGDFLPDPVDNSWLFIVLSMESAEYQLDNVTQQIFSKFTRINILMSRT